MASYIFSCIRFLFVTFYMKGIDKLFDIFFVEKISLARKYNQATNIPFLTELIVLIYRAMFSMLSY